MGRFEFSKLGDALRFGMQSELPKLLKSNPSDKGIYLYGSLSYMFLHGFICNYTAAIIEHIILINCIKGSEIEDGINSVSSSLFSDLIEKLPFNNAEELFEMLNKHEVPDWCFYIGNQIVDKSDKGPFICDDSLYFISRASGKNTFASVNTRRINEDTNLNDEDYISVIAFGYNEIHGYDDKLKRAYLGVENQEEFFHSYDLATDTFTIHPYKFLELCDNVPYVITRDMHVAYLLRDKVHEICECHDYENYTYDPDAKCFNVYPDGMDTKVFYPFKITVEGERKTLEDIKCQKYIWNELKHVADAEDTYESFFRRNKEENTDVPMPDEFSFDGIMGNFVKYVASSKRCTNKRYILFENIMNVLGTYVDKLEDISRLIYVLYDADRLFKKDSSDDFPSEQLYWRVKEISTIPSESKKLSRLLKGKMYDEVFGLFTHDVFSLNELQREFDKKESAKIGTFIVDGENFESNTFDMSEGVVVGNQIMINADYSKCSGIVTYDCVDDCYYVVSKDVIKTGTRLGISFRFNIRDSKVIYSVNPELGK